MAGTRAAGRIPRSNLAIVVATTRPSEVMDAFARLPQIVTVVERTDRGRSA